jgi:hypothetical protein
MYNVTKASKLATSGNLLPAGVLLARGVMSLQAKSLAAPIPINIVRL